VAHVFTTLPISELSNVVFRLEGARHTPKELAGLFKAQVEHVDIVPGEMGAVSTVYSSI
jgi:hypothetical protein